MSGSGEGPDPAGVRGEDAGPSALTGREELFAAVFESSTAGLAILSGPELRFDRVNPAFRALMERPEEDAVGRRVEEAWIANDPDVLAAFRRVLETAEPWHREDHAVAIDGTIRRFSIHAKRVAVSDRAVILVVLWETTALWEARRIAQEAADRALRHASELDAIIDALPDGFVLYGPRGEVRRMNAAAERFAALEPEERGLPYAARFGRYRVATAEGRALAHDETPVARALAGETVRSAHLQVEGPAGKRWVLASAAPIRAPGGAVWGAVSTFSDESVVRELEEAREDLVRMISHDLRTPLNAVLAQAHLLRLDRGDAAKVEERARSITRSCQRMAGMIQDLLEATLIEAGQLRMRTRPVDLADFVPQAIERQRGALAVERVIAVARGPIPPVAADPDRLERILVNLVSNALKYSPPQGTVTVEIAPAEGGATIAVLDRGVGIAPEDLPHVFERFFRARGARRPEGLGLGLYITRLLVHAHRGRIDVDSQLGQGSAFRVFLPTGPLPGRPGRP